MKRVSLSKAAAADIEAIDDYTIEHFGLDQAIRTSERFRETLELLGEMPRSGRLREDISYGQLGATCFSDVILKFGSGSPSMRMMRPFPSVPTYMRHFAP